MNVVLLRLQCLLCVLRLLCSLFDDRRVLLVVRCVVCFVWNVLLVGW